MRKLTKEQITYRLYEHLLWLVEHKKQGARLDLDGLDVSIEDILDACLAGAITSEGDVYSPAPPTRPAQKSTTGTVNLQADAVG